MTQRLAPRPHQTQALTDLAIAFGVHDRAQLVMACGTGKTLVARWHAEASLAERVLVVVPSLALLAQTLREWRRPRSWPFEALVVCSDPTTTAGAAERADAEGADVDEPFWASQRAAVTTNPAIAAKFLQRAVRGRPQVVFSTYHSAPVVAHAQAAAGSHGCFDLAVMDEAHRLTGRPRDEFRVVLDAQRVRATRRLFMTATPQAVDSADPGVLSMDDHDTFGPVAHTVGFADAIDHQLLVDYRVLVIATRSDQPEEPDPSTTLPASVVAAADSYGVRRMLSFHGRVRKATAFATALDAETTPGQAFIRARAVHGGQSSADRAAALTWLGDPATHPSQLRLLSSARCLSEGVDVPAVDGILFADPRSSAVDVIQAVGRVLRPAPGKTRGTVIIPVALDDTGDDDSTLTTSAWEPVWTVLRALRAHDGRFAEEIAAAAAAARPFTPGGWRPERIDFVLPAGVDLDAVALRVVQEVGTAWERFYALLSEWVADNGGRRIPYSLIYQGAKLGWWAERQRLAHRRGVLPAERVTRLERLSGWAWDRADAEFDDTISILTALAETRGGLNEHGTESPYAGVKTATKPQLHLGTWVAMQRQAYRMETLPADRVKKLEAVPGWRWGVLSDEDTTMVDALAMFVEFEKTARVPTSHVEDGLQLGRWCWDVRRRYWTGRIQPSLIDEITAATPSRWAPGEKHWSWEKLETQWRLAFTALRQYAEREGHASPPGGHREQLPDATISLGQWVALQRHHRRRGDLDDDHAAALERLPGWRWDAAGITLDGEEPIDLGGRPHGTAGAIAAGCKCTECLNRRRGYGRAYLARRRDEKAGLDTVPAGPVRAHIKRLQTEISAELGAKPHQSFSTAIAYAAHVPYGIIKALTGPGDAGAVERAHADALLALTTGQVVAVAADRAGSRGRPASTANERVPAKPTKILLARLDARGFRPVWVARELGYARKVQIGHEWVTRRVADAVEDLFQRVGDLSWHGPRNKSAPPLAELQAQQAQRRSA